MKEELRKFLAQIVLKISESDSDINIVYPFLEDNLDKLNYNFAQLLRHWATNYFAGESPDQTQAVAGIIGNFGVLIAEFPHGNIADNLDIAIACFEVIEVIFNFDNFPEFWASSKCNLGNTYGKRIYGDSVENLEKALLAYQDALKIYTYEEFPLNWAEIQNNWVSFYVKKSRTTKTKVNYSKILENIVEICNLASDIFRQNKLIGKWAIVKNALASAYCDLPNDNYSEKWELAINIYNEILEVINQNTFFQEWANTQMNLGIAYNKIFQGDRLQNLQLAVNACHNALKFYTRENYPFVYATLQNNLGNAYRDQGLTTQAIACYRLNLEIHTPEIYPADAIISGRNFGNTALKAGLWKEAIEGYSIAVNAVEQSRTWVKSEYRRQEILEKSIDIYKNIVQACINAGQIDKAVEYAERSRSKRLVDLMASYN